MGVVPVVGHGVLTGVVYEAAMAAPERERMAAVVNFILKIVIDLMW